MKSARRKAAGLKRILLQKSTQAKFTAWSAARRVIAQTAVPRLPQEAIFAPAAAENYKNYLKQIIRHRIIVYVRCFRGKFYYAK